MLTEQIDKAAACRGDAPYLEDAAGAATLTYAGLRDSVRAWARHLDDAGIPSGARVAVRLADPFGYAGALVGILAAGRVAVPLDPGAPAAEVARVLKVAQPQAVAGGGLEPGLPVLEIPVPRLPGLDPAPAPAGTGARGGIFLCTSGTTGTPKGILLSEAQLMHVAGAVAAHHRLTPADRGYCCLPLFHINAEVVGLLATLVAGGRLVLDRKFRRRGFWELIETRQITWINAVPAIITILAMDPPVATPGRVRFIRSASAPLAPSALRRFEETFGIPVVETYGMTEAASMITANPLDGPRKAAARSACPSVPRSGWSAGTATCSSRARPVRSAGCRSGAPASSRSYAEAGRPTPSTRTAGSRPATSATWTRTATCSWPAGPTT